MISVPLAAWRVIAGPPGIEIGARFYESIFGGSNGGLLVGNMLTRYPDLFGAIDCAVPLLDMKRYTKLTAGASWTSEYGDPEKPEDWAFLRELSAYHHVEPSRRYPPILLTTSARDDQDGG